MSSIEGKVSGSRDIASGKQQADTKGPDPDDVQDNEKALFSKAMNRNSKLSGDNDRSGTSPGTSKGLPSPGSSKGLPSPGTSEGLPSPGTSRNLPSPGTAKSTASPGSAENSSTAAPGKNSVSFSSEKGLVTNGPATAKGLSADGSGKGSDLHGVTKNPPFSKEVNNPGDPAGSIQASHIPGGIQSTSGNIDAGASASVSSPGAGENISDLAEKLASRILASKPESGSQEVRIELNANKLQGTVITLKQDANGLSVIFNAPTPEVSGRLAETKADLAQRLQNSTGDNVNIDIKENDDNAGQDPQDGRSRNQYEADDNDDNETVR